jgi:hypothetical protein
VSVPGQVGTMVLSASDGSVLSVWFCLPPASDTHQSGGELKGDANAAALIYQLLLDASVVLTSQGAAGHPAPLRKLTGAPTCCSVPRCSPQSAVSFPQHVYHLAVTGDKIVAVKRLAS